MDPSRKIPSNMKRKMRGSNSKMLQYRWNGSFQLQTAANYKENGQNRRSKKKSPKREKNGENNSGPILIWYIYILCQERSLPWNQAHLSLSDWRPGVVSIGSRSLRGGVFKALLCETVLVSKSWAYCLWCLWRSHWQTRLASCLGNLPAGSDPNVQPQSWQ